MGADAIVFFNEKRFASHPLRKFFKLDDATGQLFTESLKLTESDLGEIEAISRRLGSYSELNNLIKILCPILPADSIIISKILYQSLIVPVEEIMALQEEVDLINSNDVSKGDDVKKFISNLNDLIRVAKRENNPIVIT